MNISTRIIKSLSLVTIFVVAAAASGCGDDEGSSSPSQNPSGGTTTDNGSTETTTSDATEVSTGSLSKAEFMKRTDAICQETRERFDAKAVSLLVKKLKQESEGKISPEKIKKERTELTEEFLIPLYEEQIEKIRSLGAPAGDEEAITSFLQATQDSLDEASVEPNQYYASGNQDFPEARELAKAYGLAGCAQTMDLTSEIVVR